MAFESVKRIYNSNIFNSFSHPYIMLRRTNIDFAAGKLTQQMGRLEYGYLGNKLNWVAEKFPSLERVMGRGEKALEWTRGSFFGLLSGKAAKMVFLAGVITYIDYHVMNLVDSHTDIVTDLGWALWISAMPLRQYLDIRRSTRAALLIDALVGAGKVADAAELIKKDSAGLRKSVIESLKAISPERAARVENELKAPGSMKTAPEIVVPDEPEPDEDVISKIAAGAKGKVAPNVVGVLNGEQKKTELKPTEPDSAKRASEKEAITKKMIQELLGEAEKLHQGTDELSVRTVSSDDAEIKSLMTSVALLRTGRKKLIDELGGPLMELNMQIGFSGESDTEEDVQRAIGERPEIADYYLAIKNLLPRIKQVNDEILIKIGQAEAKLAAIEDPQKKLTALADERNSLVGKFARLLEGDEFVNKRAQVANASAEVKKILAQAMNDLTLAPQSVRASLKKAQQKMATLRLWLDQPELIPDFPVQLSPEATPYPGTQGTSGKPLPELKIAGQAGPDNGETRVNQPAAAAPATVSPVVPPEAPAGPIAEEPLKVDPLQGLEEFRIARGLGTIEEALATMLAEKKVRENGKRTPYEIPLPPPPEKKPEAPKAPEPPKGRAALDALRGKKKPTEGDTK